MKRIISLLLIACLLLSGCAGSGSETTEPSSEAPSTQATTEATEAPTTAPTTEPATEPATEPPTQPTAPAEPEEEGPDSVIALALVGVALSCFALGALIFGRRKPAKKGKGRYSR